MIKKFLLLVAVSIVFIACSEEKDPFLISKDAVGPLTKEVRVNQLDSVFANDSIVTRRRGENLMSNGGEIEIYDNEGKKLLLLSPEKRENPGSKVSNIQIFDSRYKTEKGLSLSSTFKDIKDNYTISNIQNTGLSVVISLKETDVYVTIDKASMAENISFGEDVKAEDIPDDATFKYFMVGWEE